MAAAQSPFGSAEVFVTGWLRISRGDAACALRAWAELIDAFTRTISRPLARQPQNGKVQILPADAQLRKTVYTAGAERVEVSSLIGTSRIRCPRRANQHQPMAARPSFS